MNVMHMHALNADAIVITHTWLQVSCHVYFLHWSRNLGSLITISSSTVANNIVWESSEIKGYQREIPAWTVDTLCCTFVSCALLAELSSWTRLFLASCFEVSKFAFKLAKSLWHEPALTVICKHAFSLSMWAWYKHRNKRGRSRLKLWDCFNADGWKLQNLTSCDIVLPHELVLRFHSQSWTMSLGIRIMLFLTTID